MLQLQVTCNWNTTPACLPVVFGFDSVNGICIKELFYSLKEAYMDVSIIWGDPFARPIEYSEVSVADFDICLHLVADNWWKQLEKKKKEMT